MMMIITIEIYAKNKKKLLVVSKTFKNCRKS